jgi:hypothetical protein
MLSFDAFIVPALLFVAIGLLTTLLMKNLDIVEEALEVLSYRGLIIWIPLGIVALVLSSLLPDHYEPWVDLLAIAYGIVYGLCLLLVPVVFLVALYNVLTQRSEGIEWRLQRDQKLAAESPKGKP